MTNGIYFYNTIREEWSASTSPNETPRPSFVHDGGDPTTLVEEASSSSSSSTSAAMSEGSLIYQTQIPPGDGGKLGFSNLKFSSFKELEAATRKFRRGGSSVSPTQIPPNYGGKSGFSNLKNFSFKELEAATRKFKVDGVLGEGRFGIVCKGWIDINALTPTKPGKGIAVAVKRFNQQGFEGRREWLVTKTKIQVLYPTSEGQSSSTYVQVI